MHFILIWERSVMASRRYVQCGDGIVRDSHKSISEIRVVEERSVNDI